MTESHRVHDVTYGLHGVVDDHVWVVLVKMVAQRLVGSLSVDKKQTNTCFQNLCGEIEGAS